MTALMKSDIAPDVFLSGLVLILLSLMRFSLKSFNYVMGLEKAVSDEHLTTNTILDALSEAMYSTVRM